MSVIGDNHESSEKKWDRGNSEEIALKNLDDEILDCEANCSDYRI
jgi:hypothetical protein